MKRPFINREQRQLMIWQKDGTADTFTGAGLWVSFYMHKILRDSRNEMLNSMPWITKFTEWLNKILS